VKPAAVPQPPAAEAQSPQAQRSVSAKPPEVQLTADQIQAGDRGLAAAALNFLFWGVGYFQAGVKRPFGRTWLLCPLVYVIYAFVGQLFFFTPLLAGESTIQTTIPTGNGTSIPITTTGYNPYPSLLTKDLEILAFLVPGIILGLFLARDVYRRIASSYGDPPSIPAGGAALRNFVKRQTDQINPAGKENNPELAFAILGGVILVLGSLYLTTLDWLSSQTLNIGGIGELEGAVLGALIIYVAIVSTSRPAWRQQAGVFIIGMALITLTVAKEDAVYLGLGFAVIGGALLIAKPEARAEAT
jgi:hypothetical protein